MKALVVIGVLATALAGCSRQPPLAEMPPCAIMIFCHTAAAAPVASQPMTRDQAATKQASVVRKPSRGHAHAVRLASAHSHSGKIATTREAPRVAPAPPLAPTIVAEPHPAPTAARTIQQQVVAAAGVAERLSASDANASSEPRRSETASAEAGTAVSPGKTDGLVVVLMARPEIKSLAELTGKTVAIDGRYSASNANVRTAIAAAGALEVQMSQGQTLAIDRLVNGETPAAVLALVSASAAESFPDIAGYKTFHIPLSPHALNK